MKILDYTTRVNTYSRFLLDATDLPNILQVHLQVSKHGHCRLCNKQIELVYRAVDCEGGDDDQINIFSCNGCGWWFARRDSGGEMSSHYAYPSIRSFDTSDIDIPLRTLEMELLKRPHIIHEIHPTKLELLCKSVLEDFFDVQVTHIGRSGDKGIDLLYVHGNRNFAVQVKRRASPKSVEGVSVVREFLASAMLSSVRNCLFVTTAERFTRGASEVVSESKKLGLVDQYELVDREQFFEMFRYASRRAQWPWEEVFYYDATHESGSLRRVDINKSTIMKKQKSPTRQCS